MLMSQHFFNNTVSYEKYGFFKIKFQNVLVFEKYEKIDFFEKLGLTAKPDCRCKQINSEFVMPSIYELYSNRKANR